MHPIVGPTGDNVLLGEHLDAIGNRLENAEGSPTVRANAVLDASDDLTLTQGEEEHRTQPNGDEDDGASQARDQLHGPSRQEPRQQVGEPEANVDE